MWNGERGILQKKILVCSERRIREGPRRGKKDGKKKERFPKGTNRREKGEG